MLNRVLRQEPLGPRSLSRAWRVKGTAAALLAGIVAGVAILVAGPVPALLGLLGLIVALAAFRYPEMLIVLMLALASQLIPSRFNIFVDLAVARFQVSDLLLFWLLAVTVLRVVVERGFPFRSTPLDLPMVLFYATVLGGLATSVIGFGINFNNATYEARTLVYYLAFFPITNLVRTHAQVARLATGTIGVAVLLAASMVLQSAVQPAFLVDDWVVDGRGVIRIFHPGFSVVYVGLLMVVGYAAVRRPGMPSLFHRWRWLQWVTMLLLLAALLSTLARNLLIGGLISLGLLVFVLRDRERSNLRRTVLAAVAGLALLLAFVAVASESPAIAEYAEAYGNRIERMFSSEILSREENLFSRWEEMSFAISRLREHPILGIGLYNPYRPAFFREEEPTLRHFIHNAYLGLWLKTGLLGLVAFLWLSAAFLRFAYRGWQRVSDPLLRGVAVGSLVAYVGLLFMNFVAPSFLQPGSLGIMGVTMGLTAAILLLDSGAQQEKTEGDSA